VITECGVVGGMRIGIGRKYMEKTPFSKIQILRGIEPRPLWWDFFGSLLGIV
jgi:hypothetical protein